MLFCENISKIHLFCTTILSISIIIFGKTWKMDSALLSFFSQNVTTFVQGQTFRFVVLQTYYERFSSFYVWTTLSTGGYMRWIRPPSCSGWTCLFTFQPTRTKADIFPFPKQLSEPKSVEFTQRNEGTKSREKQRIWQLPNSFILAWICSLISLREFSRFEFWQLFWTQENKSFWFIKFECQ